MFCWIHIIDFCKCMLLLNLKPATHFKYRQGQQMIGKVVQVTAGDSNPIEMGILERLCCLQAGMGWGSPLCETHDCIKDVTTWTQKHFVTLFVSIWSHTVHISTQIMSQELISFFFFFLWASVQRHLFTLAYHVLFHDQKWLCFLGQSVHSRSALLCHPRWTLAPPPRQGFGRDLKLHQICRHHVLNLPKSPSLRSWISLQSCTVPAYLVSGHKMAFMC